MRIIVCIKSVLGTMVKNVGRKLTINPYDLYALNQARIIKEKEECEVICLNMGVSDPLIQVEAELYGCDKTIFLCDKKFSKADTLATSLSLTEAIKRIGEYDYIFCGAVSLDGETGQVAPNIACMLGVPFMGLVSEVDICGGALRIIKKNAEKTCLYEGVKGMVVGFDNLILGKVLSLFQVKRTVGIKMNIWNAVDIGVEEENIGEMGSRTKVINTRNLDVQRQRKCIISNNVDEFVDYIKVNVLSGCADV